MRPCFCLTEFILLVSYVSYHIINESKREKTAVASDRLRHAAQHWEGKKQENYSTFSPTLISPRIRVWLSLKILFSRLCDCDPFDISVMFWKHQGVVFVFTLQFFFNHLSPVPQSSFVLEKISYQCLYLTPHFHRAKSRKLSGLHYPTAYYYKKPCCLKNVQKELPNISLNGWCSFLGLD